METTITQSSFSNKFTELHGTEKFFELIESFRAKARTEGLTSYEHILYNQLRGLPLDRGFTPVTNEVKLANGADKMFGYKSALSTAKYYLKHKPEMFSKVGITKSNINAFEV